MSDLSPGLPHPARLARAVIAVLLFFGLSVAGQVAPHPIKVEVRVNQRLGEWRPVWNYFGYDEPNYTYTENGKKLLGELAAASPVPIYVRTHNLFTSGDGSASMKWGSTNVYSEDSAGNAVYDWSIVDRIFDTYHAAGIKPLVELGFMPEALSTHPEPYRHNFPNGTIFTGWAYPPKDYQKWADLVFHFVAHLRDRYGEAETRSWLWEVWNEPDIDYWKGTQEEFFKLYDFSADAVMRALPGARIGGPDTTGPGSGRAEQYLRAFLEHCVRGKNYVSGKTSAPLGFISFHPKGKPEVRDGVLIMGSRHHLEVVERGLAIVASDPKWRKLPVILGESDPGGCAACSARQHPENAYRNGPLYAAYTVAVLHQISQLAARAGVNFQGAVTWAFEFEEQPAFAGYRELATNGIDKPVLNGFRMLGMLGGERVEVSSSGAIATDEFLRSGVSQQPDINAMATREPRRVAVLIWNYQDRDVPMPAAAVDLVLSGLPPGVSRARLENFRIDETHSNAYTEWKRLGSPEKLTHEQLKGLEAAGQLQSGDAPRQIEIVKGSAAVNLSLPTQSLSLIRVTW